MLLILVRYTLIYQNYSNIQFFDDHLVAENVEIWFCCSVMQAS